MKEQNRIVAICGATGFIGSHLAAHLRKAGYTIVPVGRDLLDGGNEKQLAAALAPCNTIVCVTGATISHRWSKTYKRKMYDSRIGVVRKLRRAIEASGWEGTFISASAVGYYPSEGCHDETAALPGDDFLAGLCREWEAETHKMPDGVRTCVTRFGVVLSPDGGAFIPLVRPARFGIVAVLGNGRQPFSWIGMPDLCRAMQFLIESECRGTFNVTAPERLTQREAARKIGSHYRTRITLPVPAFGIRLVWGEAADVLLKGQCAVPARLTEAGFAFCTPDLSSFLSRISRN